MQPYAEFILTACSQAEELSGFKAALKPNVTTISSLETEEACHGHYRDTSTYQQPRTACSNTK